MVAQRVLVLLAKVRFLLGRQVKKQLHGIIGSIPDFRSGGGGSKSPYASAEAKLAWIMPSAWRFSKKSIWSLYGVCSSVGRVPGCGSGGRGFDPHQTPKCFNSKVVVQLTCNEQVVGSNPT